jgi:hypothetical protein
MTGEDASLAAQVLHERVLACRIPAGKDALRRVIAHLEEQRLALGADTPAATLKTEWVAPGRGETVGALLSLFAAHADRDDLHVRTSLTFVRPGPPCAYDLERAREALRREGLEFP